MMLKNLKTYKTNHPTIKEISIGDQFITYGGEIVTFIEYSGLNHSYPFNFECFVRNRTGKKNFKVLYNKPYLYGC